MKTHGRVRAGGAFGLLVLASILLSVMPAAAQTVLPYANAGGYATTEVRVNTTDHPIDVVIEDRVYPPLVVRYPPHSVTRTPNWPRFGVSVEPVELVDGMEMYVEIRTLLGTIVRVDPLEPVPQAAYFYDLPTDDTFESYIFACAPGGDGLFRLVASDESASDYSLRSSDAVLIPVDDSFVRLLAFIGPVSPVIESGLLYTFAIVVHDVTGAITTVTPHLR